MVNKLLNKIKRDIRFRDKIEHIETIPLKEAEYGVVEDLPGNIREYLEENNIKLYQHQAQSFKHVRGGENVLITTPTASGKTMAFNMPIMEQLTLDDEATALYIYPAKALANDQQQVIKSLEKDLKIDIKPNIYDGDTPKEERPWIKKNSRLILTNPYELHLILYWHHQWEKFYRNLKFIVIDEAHQYRGVFGSNVAFLIRRLRRICKHYGSNPQFILSSATLANHEEFSRKLVGKSFQLISRDTSPRGEKHFILYNPYKKKTDLSVHQETSNLFLYFILHDLQTLCFTVSRKMAELIAMWSKKEIDQRKPRLTEKITAYRAGYLAEERRKIEERLRSGDLIGVTTTNALELGINIGSLDAVIISGYPGTMISTWQQAGRSGRKHNDSLVVLVAFQNALDQYFMNNPHFFFDKAHENAIIDLQNQHIIHAHLQCAVNELPLTREELNEYFDVDESYLQDLINDGVIRKTPHNWIYIANDSPAFKHGLDQISSDTFKVMHSGKLLERMERSHAYREAHEGAVLINQGETYTVESFDNRKKFINVAKRTVDYHTQVLKDVDIKIMEKVYRRDIGALTVNFGELEVSEDFYKYKLMNYRKVLGTYPLDLPALKFSTKGMWFTLPSSLKDILEDKFNGDDIFPGGLHGTEHALIALFPLHVMCDRMDIGGLSTPYHPDTQEPTIFIYDAYEGGIGLAEKAVEVFEELVKSTRDMVYNCQCKEGCPSCIYSPKCGNENRPLHKDATSHILKKMIHAMESGKVDEVVVDYLTKSSASFKKSSMGSESYVEYNSFDKLKQRSMELYHEENFEDALSFIDKALEIKAADVELLKYKSLTLQKLGNQQMALEYINQAFSIKPKDKEIIFLLSTAQYHCGEYMEAKHNLSDILTIDPKFDNAWYLLGLILQAQGDVSGAIQFFSRVLSINPDHEDASESLRKLL
ncbi:DEAD/DEAH box helicase [Methanobacterium alcaliphilum]|uniref:DEAD/DEAH box helicase n=1 Tax=Methanobacterium alcaliphilum TaxID=392018 RepID=UPI00200A2921|nr:DEAD/DEAH box helicase [Methanobacterium alcaliphilum]MCK9151849.1 DEAD/DEAH box helicase [Methanobacterium alcaliphilum]